jgi:hypothetical protein
MNKLPPKAADLLEEARRSHRAPPADLERTLTRLHATLLFTEAGGALADGAARSDPATLTSSTPALGGRGSALFTGHGVKWLIATVAIGGAVGGTVLTRTAGTKPASRTVPAAQEASNIAAPQWRAAAERAPSSNLAHASNSGAAVALARSDEARGTQSGGPARARSAASGAVASSRGQGETQAEAASAWRGRSGVALSGKERARSVKRAQIERATAAASLAQSRAAEPVSAPDAAEESDARTSSVPAQAVAAAPGELDLIDGALARLRDQNGAAALSLLAQHDELYPRGKFATERKGLRVLALCAVGRVREGRQAQAAFLEQARGAPIAARVRRACEPEKP